MMSNVLFILPSGDDTDEYCIIVGGLIDAATCARLFDALSVVAMADGTTHLRVRAVDQAALYGVLARLRDLGLALVEVRKEPSPPSR
jgi:hypothetical protein